MINGKRPEAVECECAKRCFVNEKEANRELGFFWKTGRRKKLPSRVYSGCECGHWHMTKGRKIPNL